MERALGGARGHFAWMTDVPECLDVYDTATAASRTCIRPWPPLLGVWPCGLGSGIGCRPM